MSDHPPELLPGDGDTPGPFSTPAQDADVRALLGTLRGEDVPMPDDVVLRINAAITAERAAATLPDSPAALLDGGDSDDATSSIPAPRGGTVTVLPGPEARRGPSYAGMRRILAVAAAVVVVVGAGAVVRGIGGLAREASTSGGSAATAADASGGSTSGPVVSTSGRDYSANDLSAQAKSLVAADRAPTVATPTPESSRSGSLGYAAPAGAALAACLTALSVPSGTVPVAVDAGTYEGAPAVVLVLPTENDPADLDVYVVAPGCGTKGEPTILEFQRVPRP